MGSWSRREGKAPAFPRDTASFFKIVLDKALRHGILDIPQAVAMKYGDGVVDIMFLKVPDGAVWPVELIRRNGRIWLHRGWPEFAQFYALQHGYVLLFSSEEDYCSYRVRIFMRNTLEIDYSHNDETNLSGGEDDFPIKRDAGGSSSSQTALKETADVLGRMNTLTESEKALALQRTSAFKPEDPYFPIVLQPAYIHKGYLRVPSEFAKRYLIKLPLVCGIILRTSEGRTWPVEMKLDSSSRLQLGWSDFVRDNNMKAGDVCVFVLIDRSKMLFEVLFFRDPVAENCPLFPGEGHGNGAVNPLDFSCKIGKYKRPSSALKSANQFIPKNPFFKATVKTSSVMSLPSNFVKKFINEKKQIVTLQVGEISWPVNLNAYRNNSTVALCGGWSAFVYENCLGDGDVCTFELVETNNIVLKVHIFRR